MKVFSIFLLLSVLGFSSCSSVLRPVSVTNISQSKFVAEVFAIHWTSTDAMKETAQNKAAETALDNGYEWFVVDDVIVDNQAKGDYKLTYFFTCGTGEKPKDAIDAKSALKK
ncbi:MAG: hypothetical protein HPY53_01555 [Brevinematales bacterium]|nr:hypothetical protein [Brevinematales bacterium]